MARPRPTLPAPAEIRALADAAGLLEVRAAPGAAADAVVLPAIAGGPLTIRTTAPPEDGRANAAVLRLLARALGCAPSALHLVRGATARTKLVRLPPAD